MLKTERSNIDVNTDSLIRFNAIPIRKTALNTHQPGQNKKSWQAEKQCQDFLTIPKNAHLGNAF
jgi:hypothetical protein